MTDARITIDELVIECAVQCTESEAHRLGGSIAQELAHQLEQLQARRMAAICRGSSAPRPIRIERVVVRLATRNVSPTAIGRSLRHAIDGARRHDERSV